MAAKFTSDGKIVESGENQAQAHNNCGNDEKDLVIEGVRLPR